MRRKSFASILLASSFLLACGGGSSGDDDSPTADGGSADAASGDFTELVGADWTLEQGAEKYWCTDITLDHDVYLNGYRPIAPLGTHHTVLAVNTAGGADNPGYACDAGTDAPDWLFASGIGTPPLILPPGVGVHLTAGTQIHLNLHLFNTSESTITGHSGIEVKLATPADVVNEAQIFLPGPFGFQIPGDGQPYSYTGTCTVSHDQTLVAIFPHMHQTGSHFKSVLVHQGVETVLWDDDYQFDSQEFANLSLIPVTSGDQIKTTCTWENDTGSSIHWGQSSTAEMCFSILMRYPILPNEEQGGQTLGLPACTDENNPG
jgi:hypothetical protein